MKIYLAGPISGMSDKAAYGWRTYAEEVLESAGHTVFTPLRVDFVVKKGKLKEVDLQAGLNAAQLDYDEIATSDVLLVNFTGATKVSIGTCVEIGWAQALEKRVLVVLPPRGLHDHSFVRWAATDLFNTLEEVLCFVLEQYAR